MLKITKRVYHLISFFFCFSNLVFPVYFNQFHLHIMFNVLAMLLISEYFAVYA